MPFLRIPHDPARTAMGGTEAAYIGSISQASYVNASLLPFADGRAGGQVSYQTWMPSSMLSADYINVGFAANINDKVGIAIGYSKGTDKESYDVTDEDGFSSGTFTPSNVQANLALGVRFVKFMSIGVNVRYALHDLTPNESLSAFAADAFLTGGFKGVIITAGVSSIGGDVNGYSLPTSLTFGLSKDFKLGEKHNLAAAAQYDYYLSGAMNGGLGLEYGFNDMLFVRCGSSMGKDSVIPSYTSAGVGLKFFGIALNGTMLLSEDTGNAFLVGLGYSF